MDSEFLKIFSSSIMNKELLAQIPGVNLVLAIIGFLKIASYILSPIFLFLFIYFIVKLDKLRQSVAPKPRGVIIPGQESAMDTFQLRWADVVKHIDSTREAEWKFSVIEADKLIEDALKTFGFEGDTMADKLAGVDKTKLLTIDELWEAHKIRNRVVHDANYFLRYTEARKAIESFEKVLKEIGAL